MRFMMLVKANQDSEAGVMPNKGLVAEMGELNEAMAKAGVLLAGEGLHPSSKGARVTYTGRKRLVTDGPFAETKELLAGFWMIEVASRAEALEWASRIPFTDGEVVEVRQVFEASEFPADVLPPEAAAREEALRAELAKKAKVAPVRGARQLWRWKGTSTTTTPRRKSRAPFTRRAVWLCSRCCHHRRGTNSGMTMVTTEFASRSRIRPM
jgi:hypothetical protein